MTKFFLMNILLVFFLPTSSSWAITTPEKCTDNQKYIKYMIDKGAIRDSTYFSRSEIKQGLEEWAKFRRELRINADKLTSRMTFIANLIKKKNAFCLQETILLHDDLIKYINNASQPANKFYHDKILPKELQFHDK